MIAFDAVSQGSANAGTVSFSHTTSGSNRILIALIVGFDSNSGPNINSVSYNGTSMTQVLQLSSPSATTQYGLYYLINPTSGAHTFSASSGGTGSLNVTAFTLSYTGALQSGQPDSSNSGANGSISPFNASTTVVANGSWLVSMFNNRGGGTSGVNSPSIQRGTQLSNLIVGDSNGLVSPGSKSIAFTSTSPNGEWLILSIAPDAPPVSANAASLLMMLG